MPDQPTSESTAAPAAEKKTRRPGRPPKKKISNINVVTQGIVSEPAEPEHILEIVYDNPILFKKIFALLKSYTVTEVVFNFRPTSIEIATKDHTKDSTIMITIQANLLSRYYCKGAVSRCVKRESIEKVFNRLDKNHPQITFYLREDDSESLLHIIVFDSEVDAKFSYEIPLIQQGANMIEPTINDDSDYPLKFTLPSGHFKNKVKDAGESASIISFIKSYDGPLQIAYEQSQKLTLDACYENQEKIKLISKLDPDDLFSVSVNIDNIINFSNSNIGIDVTICCDKERPISFTSLVDKKKHTRENGVIAEDFVCCIKMYTKLRHMNRG